MKSDEEIGARTIRVLESQVLHAADTIHWLDGATSDATAKMARIGRRLVVEFTGKPPDVETLGKVGQMAFWRRAAGKIFEGVATEAQKTRGAASPFSVAGTVREPEGFYNPRAFAVNLGSGEGHGIVLYPSPAGVRWPRGGGIIGTLAGAGTGLAVPWGLLELSVTVSEADTLIFRAQADRHGDFALAMSRLPPLPQNIAAYAASLSVKANLGAAAGTPVDLDLLEAVELGELESDSFLEEIAVEIVPGEVQRVHSLDVTYLAVQAVD